jgi:hypothetical protein
MTRVSGKSSAGTKGQKLSKSGKRGRPSRIISKQDTDTIKELLNLGAEMKVIAKALGISLSLLNRWRKNEGEVKNIFDTKYDDQSAELEQSLYNLAKGFEYTEEKAFSFQGEVIKTTITRYNPPNINALQFYLSNTKPDKWKMKSDINHNVRPVVSRRVKRFDGSRDDED